MSLGSFLPPYLGNSSSSKKLMRESLFSVWHFLWFTFWGRMLELKFYFYPKDINLQSPKIVCSNSQASSHIVWALATMISMATPKCWSSGFLHTVILLHFFKDSSCLQCRPNQTILLANDKHSWQLPAVLNFIANMVVKCPLLVPHVLGNQTEIDIYVVIMFIASSIQF